MPQERQVWQVPVRTIMPPHFLQTVPAETKTAELLGVEVGWEAEEIGASIGEAAGAGFVSWALLFKRGAIPKSLKSEEDRKRSAR